MFYKELEFPFEPVSLFPKILDVMCLLLNAPLTEVANLKQNIPSSTVKVFAEKTDTPGYWVINLYIPNQAFAFLHPPHLYLA